MKNIMYFENGIEHEFSDKEMNLLKELILKECKYEEGLPEDNKTLTSLKSVFLEHLD